MLNKDLSIRLEACELLSETGHSLYCAVSVNQLLGDIKKFDICCVPTYLYGLDGFTTYDNVYNKYLIVASSKYFNRYKFTIAHELGHIYLGHIKKYCSSMNINSKLLEYEANIFAEELLMPTLGIICTGLNTAEEISDHYGVSLASAKIKLSNLKRNALYQDYFRSIDLLGEHHFRKGEYYYDWHLRKTID